MMILQIKNRNFLRGVVYGKGHPVIGRDVKAPSVIAQPVRFPKCKVAKFVAVRHADQKCELNLQFPDNPLIEFRRITLFNKARQSLVTNCYDLHTQNITVVCMASIGG